MNTGAWLITLERARQIEEEGFDSTHDADHDAGQLVRAAECYLEKALAQVRGDYRGEPSREWPWDLKWWKPSESPIRNLEKAGALVAAEIDRLNKSVKNEIDAGFEDAATGRVRKGELRTD